MDIGTLTGHVEIEDQLSGALTILTSKVEEFATGFKGALGGLGITAVAVVTAIGAVITTVIELGNHGSEVNDVSAGFDRLSGTADNAQAVLASMRKGVVGTISDFDLMSQANKLLESGVKADATTFGMLTMAARVLSREGFGSLPDVMAQVDRGMQTGMLRGPLLKSLHIDLAQAEIAYAASIGKTHSELDKQEKLLADRGALMRGLADKVKAAGEQEVNFKEIMSSSVVSLKNWGDQLAASVASSPHVMAAVKAIGDQIKESFGGAGQTAIQVITGWINKFADTVAEYGPVVIRWFRTVVDVVLQYGPIAAKWVRDIASFVLDVYHSVVSAWDKVPEWFKKITIEAGLAAAAVGGINVASKAITGDNVLGIAAKSSEVYTALLVTLDSLAGKWGMLSTSIAGVGGSIALFAETAGTTLAAFAMSSITLVVGTIGLLVVATRYLTGSWEFLLGPFKDAWQMMKDVYGIGTSLVAMLYDGAKAITSYVFGPWIQGYKDAKEVISWILDHAHLMPAAHADMAPKQEQITVWGFWVAQLHNANLELSALANRSKQPELPSVAAPAGFGPLITGGVSTSEEFRLADVDAVSKWTPAQQAFHDSAVKSSQAVADFHANFSTLSDAELKNKSIQEMLLPLMDKFIASGGDLSVKERIEYDAILRTNVALKDKYDAVTSDNVQMLLSNDGIYASIKADQLKGHSLQEIAKGFGIHIEALKSVVGWWDLLTKANEGTTTGFMSALPAITNVTAALQFSGQQVEKWRGILQQVKDSTVTSFKAMLPPLSDVTYIFDIEKRHIALLDELKTKSLDLVSSIGSSISGFGQNIGGDVGAAISDIGSITSAWADAIKARDAYNKQLAAIPTGDTTAAAALQKTQNLQSAGMAFSGLSGAAMSSSVVGGVSQVASAMIALEIAGHATMAAYTLGIGLVVVGLKTWYDNSKRLEEQQKAATLQVTAYRNAVTASYGSLANASFQAEKFGLALADVTGGKGKHSTEDISRANDQLKALGDTFAKVQSDESKYNLTWADMPNLADRFEASNAAAKPLLESITRLTQAGYSQDGILKGMSGDLNSYIANALAAGVKIPPAMNPIIEKFIRMGQLTDANARAMLGLAADTMPALADITAAADRYGLKLDDLGQKVRQLKITDVANQIVSDFNLLTLAGASFESVMTDTGTLPYITQTAFNSMSSEAQKSFRDAGGVISDVTGASVVRFNYMSSAAQIAFIAAGGSVVGMHKSIQDVITDSQKLGVDLPASMKPIIEKLILAGGPDGLVDQFGSAITNTSQLKFAPDLPGAIEDLIAALTGKGGLEGSITDAIGSLTDPKTGLAAQFGSAFYDAQMKLLAFQDFLTRNPLLIGTEWDPRSPGGSLVPVAPGELPPLVPPPLPDGYYPRSGNSATSQTINIDIGGAVMSHVIKGLPAELNLVGR